MPRGDPGSFPLILVLAAVGGALALLVLDGDGAVAGLPADDFATLAYAGIWGCVLAVGLVAAARTDLGRTLRHALVWLAGFAALLGIYAYGPEFEAAGERVLAVLLPGRGAALPGREGRVLVARGRDDHFRVEADINGRPVTLLVDTGASLVALERRTAEAVGIDTAALRYTLAVQTANGLVMAAPVTLESLRIGGIERRRVRAAVGEGLGVDLLGMSFLGQLTAFEFRGDRLLLTN